VHLVGFIINKFVTMHGHTNVKLLGVLSSGGWDGMGGPCDTLVVGEICEYRNLKWKTEGKRSLWRPSFIWKDNIELDLKDRGWKGEDWIDRAREQDRWPSAVDMLRKHRIRENVGNFLTG
jgi:hypothetical protein